MADGSDSATQGASFVYVFCVGLGLLCFDLLFCIVRGVFLWKEATTAILASARGRMWLYYGGPALGATRYPKPKEGKPSTHERFVDKT